MPAPEFDSATLPWVDRDDFPAEASRRRAAGTLDETDATQLETWRRDGYLALPAAVPTALIDDLLAAYEDGWQTRPDDQMLVEGAGAQPWADVAPRETLEHHHYRRLDFHEVSETARRVMFHPTIAKRSCDDAGLDRRASHATESDVFLWQAALVHGGSPVVDRTLTRKSYVMHFSTRAGYPRDRRWPEVEPEVECIGDGSLYRRPAQTAPGLLTRIRGKARAAARRLRG